LFLKFLIQINILFNCSFLIYSYIFLDSIHPSVLDLLRGILFLGAYPSCDFLDYFTPRFSKYIYDLSSAATISSISAFILTWYLLFFYYSPPFVFSRVLVLLRVKYLLYRTILWQHSNWVLKLKKHILIESHEKKLTITIECQNIFLLNYVFTTI